MNTHLPGPSLNYIFDRKCKIPNVYTNHSKSYHIAKCLSCSFQVHLVDPDTQYNIYFNHFHLSSWHGWDACILIFFDQLYKKVLRNHSTMVILLLMISIVFYKVILIRKSHGKSKSNGTILNGKMNGHLNGKTNGVLDHVWKIFTACAVFRHLWCLKTTRLGNTQKDKEKVKFIVRYLYISKPLIIHWLRMAKIYKTRRFSLTSKCCKEIY